MSAKTALIGLVRLAEDDDKTRVSWLVRRPSVGQSFGGGDADQLEKRGELGKVAQAAVEAGPVRTMTGFRAARVTDEAEGLSVWSADGQVVEAVDEIIVLTGFRPDLTMLSEIRLDLDPRLQAPAASGTDDRSEHPLLRIRGTARRQGPGPARPRLLPRRDEELRTCARPSSR